MLTTVLQTDSIAQGTQRIILRRPKGYDFAAGNYLTIPFDGVPKYLSIANSPADPYIELAFRAGVSRFKHYLAGLKPGDSVTITRAQGGLGSYPKDFVTLLVLAGGIGITPFVSILRDLSHATIAPGHKIAVLHANRLQAQAAYMPELTAMADTNDWLCYRPYFTQEPPTRSRITAAAINSYLSPGLESKVLIAGSHRFITGMQNLLENCNYPKADITTEVFCGYCPDHACCCSHIA